MRTVSFADLRDSTSWELRQRLKGIQSALLAAFLLGWAPILGKFAYRYGVTPMTLATLRILVSTVLLWIFYLLFWRKAILLPWTLLVNCLVVGMVNGIGSLFYYNGLARLDASRAAILNALYPIWVVIFFAAAGQSITRLTLGRLAGALVGAVLVTRPWAIADPLHAYGMLLMIACSMLYAWHLVLGQWVLADVPARSGALYIITGMAITVSIAYLLTGQKPEAIPASGFYAIIALGLTTALSRLAMFFSLERIGGVQTAIISLLELAISLLLANLLLGDRLSWMQWIGALLLIGGGALARLDVERGGAPERGFNPMDV